MPGREHSEEPGRRLLRDREVAAALNISVRLVWKLTASGVLPEPMRLGRATRWRAEDIDRLLARTLGQDRSTDSVPLHIPPCPEGDKP